MKKSIIGALVVLSTFNAVPAMAAADQDTFRFECPKASGGAPSERLTNYGTYLRGMGEESLGLVKIHPIFKGITPAGVPLDLAAGAYTHAGAQYNPSTGRITCLYTSPLGDPAFNVSYEAQNLMNGWVVKADNSKITLTVLAG